MHAMTLRGRRAADADAPADAADLSAQQEVRLMELAQRNPALFAPLYERYFERIYAYCLRRVSNPQDAEDLTSQVFTRALAGLDGYRGGMVAAWLFRIAHNAVVNHLRGRRPQVALADLQLRDENPLPLEHVMHDETRQTVLELVSQLPDDQQNLLALKLAAGLSSQEIGAVIGKSPGAVRVELHRIIKRLRAQYDLATGTSFYSERERHDRKEGLR